METKRFLTTRDIVLCALGAVLIAVCSFISIPTIVPFTLQTFAVFTVLSVLGGKRGIISIAVYIALGAAGAPVFAGFKSGAAVLLGPTGGYIVGFLLTGAVYLAFVHFLGEKIWVKALSLGIGLAICGRSPLARSIAAYVRCAVHNTRCGKACSCAYNLAQTRSSAEIKAASVLGKTETETKNEYVSHARLFIFYRLGIRMGA